MMLLYTKKANIFVAIQRFKDGFLVFAAQNFSLVSIDEALRELIPAAFHYPDVVVC